MKELSYLMMIDCVNNENHPDLLLGRLPLVKFLCGSEIISKAGHDLLFICLFQLKLGWHFVNAEIRAENIWIRHCKAKH